MSLLNGLNEKQYEAASHDRGPILVIAGAGTGKTRVLTHRIANLIDTRKARPQEILAITFTNKAAREMKERIGKLVDYDVERMWIGTFHSICVRILRRDIDKLGYDTNFIIYDTDDQKTVLKNVIKRRNLDTKKYNLNVIKGIISNAKNMRISPDKYISENYGNFYHRNVGEVFAEYEKELKSANALDFDDLIIKALQLLEIHGDVLAYYQDRFKYILVDEYQDTNNVQYRLVKLLGQKEDGDSNVFVVGDDDQSIYGWRGADISNILDFEKDFENAKVVKLERNYRSTDIILEAANNVINHNSLRKGKELYTDYKNGEKIKVINVDNEREEAFMTASNIKKEHENNGVSYSEMAVLYRTNAQSRSLEEGMMALGIPYKIVGGLKFYGRKEIKDIMSYLNLIQNPKDNVSFNRIINVPKRKIGPKSLETLTAYADEREISLYEACCEINEANIALPAAARAGIENFVNAIEYLVQEKDKLELADYIEAVYRKTGYKSLLEEDTTIEGVSRIENVNEFLTAAKDFTERYVEHSLEDFLAHVSLLSDTDKTDEADLDRVTLLTVHSAKGLEFDVVFIVGLEEKMFPLVREDDENDELEEERRLFYVAVTRAKKRLYLLHANERIVFGNHEMRRVSRFINEIPNECLDMSQGSSYANRNSGNRIKENSEKPVFKGEVSFNSMFGGFKPSSGTSSSNGTSGTRKPQFSFGAGNSIVEKTVGTENTAPKQKLKSDKIVAGDKVRHKAWGIGTIVSITGEGNDQKAMIAFDSKGIKTVMLSFAPIEKI